MIKVNIMFERMEHDGERSRRATENVVGVELDMPWVNNDDPDHFSKLRTACQEHKPEGDGWTVDGIAIVEDDADAS